MFNSPRSYIWLSVAAAVITIGLKFSAYLITNSVGLLSDALESLVNLVAAIIALWALTVAAKPPDEEHAYGHYKVEYFSSGIEGALILVAAVTIALTAIPRLFNPQPVEEFGIGLVISVVATCINGVVALVLFRAGKRMRSVTLEADAHHLLTDVWTTVGVLVAFALIELTGWLRLDPLIALVVAANIIYTGVKLLRQSGLGLLDTALPRADMQVIYQALAPFAQQGIQFHAFRSRMAAQHRFVSMHVLVPGEWTVQKGHDTVERVERAIRSALADTTVFTHLEPLEDPIAFADQGLQGSDGWLLPEQGQPPPNTDGTTDDKTGA
ncbi:MAG: cation diffusion facilitator family transporter [Anaerolineae bacterium]